MGATCLVHWKDANGQASLTLLSDRLLKQFHASPIGRWTINWKVYRDTSPVSKSGTGKMMHLVHVQGGATARGVPPNSKAANLYPGSVLASSAGPGGLAGLGGVGVGGVGGLGSGVGGVGVGGPGSVGGVGVGVGGVGQGGNNPQGKTGLGISPGGGPGGVGGPGGPGIAGQGGQGQGQAAVDTSTSWCLIDDGAVGASVVAPPLASSSAAPSVANMPVGDTPPKKRAVLVEVEKDIEALIAKLKNLWVHRQHAQIEGHVYDMGDFIVRAGNILVATTSYKGILIEIEYLPQTSSATASNALIEEFVRLISPPGTILYSPQMFDYPYEQVGLDPNNWSMLHSGFQFMTLFRRQHIL
ncbi:hypothetical protein BGX29_006214 [Mortierella sp. GBA35]|nr:hypothetical protein BGX29_006214 [Mortierella sp. GBA35]KAG0216145.1 hypothetical protein BGX33_000409 [Mortierella sp. NVP41]